MILYQKILRKPPLRHSNRKGIKWRDIEVCMKSDDYYDSKEKLYAAFVESSEPEEVIQENKRTNKILDATYIKADIT